MATSRSPAGGFEACHERSGKLPPKPHFCSPKAEESERRPSAGMRDGAPEHLFFQILRWSRMSYIPFRRGQPRKFYLYKMLQHIHHFHTFRVTSLPARGIVLQCCTAGVKTQKELVQWAGSDKKWTRACEDFLFFFHEKFRESCDDLTTQAKQQGK